MPKVSVITPAYNSSQYISKAIESVLNQTFPDLEMIIVDDGSLDRTRAVVEGYVKKHPEKIKYIYQSNQGAGAARNHGLRNAKGEYIAYLDADDIWAHEKLQKQVDYLDEHPEISLTFTNAHVVKNGQITRTYTREEDKRQLNNDLFYNLFFRNFICFSSVVFRRPVIDQVGFFDESLWNTQDFEWLVRVVRRYQVAYIEECLVTYLVHETNVSKRLDIRHQNGIAILEKNLAQYPDMYEKMGKRLKTHIPQRYFEFGYALFERGEFQRARQQFLHTIVYNPFYSVKPYLYFLLSLLPIGIVSKLKGIKQGFSRSALLENTHAQG